MVQIGRSCNEYDFKCKDGIMYDFQKLKVQYTVESYMLRYLFCPAEQLVAQVLSTASWKVVSTTVN